MGKIWSPRKEPKRMISLHKAPKRMQFFPVACVVGLMLSVVLPEGVVGGGCRNMLCSLQCRSGGHQRGLCFITPQGDVPDKPRECLCVPKGKRAAPLSHSTTIELVKAPEMSRRIEKKMKEFLSFIEGPMKLVKETEPTQRRALFMMELRRKAAEFPSPFREKLGEDMLTKLAESLVDGTVFEILGGLREVQRLTESELASSRAALVEEQRRLRLDVAHRNEPLISSFSPNFRPAAAAAAPKDLAHFDAKAQEELKRIDMKTVLELDQLVSKQQQTLEKADIPTFFLTNNPQELRLQMYILQLIDKLETICDTPVDKVF